MRMARWIVGICLLRLLGAEPEHHGPFARTLGKDFDTFIQPGRCKGPVLVLFTKSNPFAVPQVRQSFEDAAKEISGLACLGILDCHQYPWTCAKQNVRRTPVVMLYPTGNRAARVYRGSFSEEGFTSAVAQMIAFNDRTVHLTHKSLQDFLTGRTRPLKVLLFSRRPRTPVIFKALSSDSELWPHMDFGFIPEEVDNQRNPLLDVYSIETVPQVMVQYGPDLSTQRTYGSNEITYSALKEWLLENRAQFWLGSPKWKETVLPEPEAVLEDPDLNYELLTPGTAGCPTDLEIKSVSECQAALKELGIESDPRWVSNYPELPSKCSVREVPSAEHPERMHFNSFVGGVGRKDLSPVCKRVKTSSSTDTGSVTKIPEIREVDIASLPEQIQGMLRNLESQFAGAAEVDLSEIMSQLTNNVAKSGSKADSKTPTKPKATLSTASTASATPAAKYEYVKLPSGAHSCPIGSEIISFEECRQAILSLGMKADPYWTSSYEGLPRHCSVREHPRAGVGLERMHFNTANRGTGRDDLAPVCRKTAGRQEASTPKSSSEKQQQGGPGASETINVIQELNVMSQRRLLGKEKYYYLVYMTKGGLTSRDESMLLDVKDHFQQRLDERGVLMDWLWLDLSIERQLRSLLDPPTLPSAMVLRGGTQPKFVLASHRDENDEAVGVMEEDIILLLNKVLGDEARFQRLNAKKLEMSWMKRN